MDGSESGSAAFESERGARRTARGSREQLGMALDGAAGAEMQAFGERASARAARRCLARRGVRLRSA